MYNTLLSLLGNTIKSNDTSQAATDTAKGLGEAIKSVDTFLSNLATCCSITLMPGEHDPTNAMLPQRPFHPCLLPKSSRFVYIELYNQVIATFYYVYTNLFYFNNIDLKALKVPQIHGLVKLKDE